MSEQRESLVPSPTVPGGVARAGHLLLGVGIVLSSIILLPEAGGVRFGFGYLWGFSFLWTILLGCLFFVALQHLTGARWSVVVRRVAEIFIGPMWLLAILFVPVVLFVLQSGTFHVFPWADAKRAAADHLIHDKAGYLNPVFFLVRAVAFLALWIGFALFFLRNSLRQDSSPQDVAGTVKMRKVSAPFMLLFAATVTFAGIDWLKSVEPHWYSTIFGVYVFSGMVVASLAVITIATVWLEKSGRLGKEMVGRDHLYNLGALLFAFVCFWAYIAFSQYMLIWYAHLPEESFYLVHRTSGGWLGVSILLVLVRFVVPFFLLLSRRAKSNPRLLVLVSALLLVGHLLDLFWLIMPQFARNVPAETASLLSSTPLLNLGMIGPALGMMGGLLYYVARFLARHSPVAVGDPLLEESRRFHL